MPFCKNDPARRYKGTEPSPKGLGWCAHAEKVGLVKKGQDKRKWIIKQYGSVKRWVVLKNGEASPKRRKSPKRRSSPKRRKSPRRRSSRSRSPKRRSPNVTKRRKSKSQGVLRKQRTAELESSSLPTQKKHLRSVFFEVMALIKKNLKLFEKRTPRKAYNVDLKKKIDQLISKKNVSLQELSFIHQQLQDQLFDKLFDLREEERASKPKQFNKWVFGMAESTDAITYFIDHIMVHGGLKKYEFFRTGTKNQIIEELKNNRTLYHFQEDEDEPDQYYLKTSDFYAYLN